MSQTRRLLTSFSLVTLSAALFGSPACSSSDDDTPMKGGEAGEAGEASVAGHAGKSSGGAPNAGDSAGGNAAGGNAASGAENAAGAGGDELGGSGPGAAGMGPAESAGAGGQPAMDTVVNATIPEAGGDVPVSLPSGQVITFTFPASAAGKHVTLTPTDATAIGWPAGQFSDVIKMEPDGSTFADPIVIKLASKNLIVLDFPSTNAKSGAQGLPLNASKDGLLLKHFSTLAVVPSGKSCDSTSGWTPSLNDERCANFGAASNYISYGCKGYNFCQIIQAHCCALPGATDCQLGDADAAVTYTDSAGNDTYSYCMPGLTSVTPSSGAVGATISVVGSGWDSYYATDSATHFVSDVRFFNQNNVAVYPQPLVDNVFAQDTTNRNALTFNVPNIPPGTYNFAVIFRNGIPSAKLPFTVTAQ
ncbi:MAG: hypothetical protein ABJB12_18155 [Pseudomonadota bacterium]